MSCLQSVFPPSKLSLVDSTKREQEIEMRKITTKKGRFSHSLYPISCLHRQLYLYKKVNLIAFV